MNGYELLTRQVILVVPIYRWESSDLERLNYLLKIKDICEQDSNRSHIISDASGLSNTLPLNKISLEFYEEAMY